MTEHVGAGPDLHRRLRGAARADRDDGRRGARSTSARSTRRSRCVIAVVKALLVVLFFMHVQYSPRLV